MENNVCKQPGEQFMWKGIMHDGTSITEFNDNGETQDIMKAIMDNKELSKFGLCGNGYYSNFDTQTGIFSLFDDTDKIQVKLHVNNDLDLMDSDSIRNKVIMFRTAENVFEPSVGHGIDRIFRYSFGYKLENEYSFIRTVMAFDMYKSVLFQLSVTGKVDMECILEFIINDKTVCKQPIQLEKNIRKEIEIPLNMTKINK